MIANPKLANTPAAETNSSPFLKLEKFKGLTGTGLAQAKKGPMLPPERSGGKMKSRGTRIVPIGSICGKGLRVSRPALSAVLSQNFKATSPCITSWTMTEKSRMIIDSARNSGPTMLYYHIC